jgi:hypothetical protein
MTASNTIFGDELFTATDLNRRAGYVLDQAKGHAVTITRNDEAFALLPRKEAARLVAVASNAKQMVGLTTAISQYRQAGKDIPAGHAFEWLNAFDMDEVGDLLTEVYQAFQRASDETISWDDFEAVLHEWHESAVAVRSEALAAAFSAPTNEVPLTQPVNMADGSV